MTPLPETCGCQIAYNRVLGDVESYIKQCSLCAHAGEMLAYLRAEQVARKNADVIHPELDDLIARAEGG